MHCEICNEASLPERHSATIVLLASVHTAIRTRTIFVCTECFNHFCDVYDESEGHVVIQALRWALEDAKARVWKTVLQQPLDKVTLSNRARNVLRQLNCDIIADVAALSDREFLRARNAGRKTYIEVLAMLKEHNLTFGVAVDRYL